ncbi:MAG: hypothetical protein HRF50_12915 [Phycisphaerae bacterium]|jgi:MinD-like ATPase involved in chromosome partitioning or flagellar assembly
MSSPQRRTNVVALVGAVPGVGVTTLAANLADCLGPFGQRVALLRPESPAELRCAPSERSRERRGAAAAPAAEDAAGAGVEALSRYDTLIVDCPSGLNEGALEVARGADRVVVVMTADRDCLVRSYALVKALGRSVRSERVGSLVNRIRDVRRAQLYAQRLRDVAQRFLDIRVDPLGVVPDDVVIPEAARCGLTAVVRYPSSAFSTAIGSVARRLEVGAAIGPERVPLWSRVAGLFL